MYSAYILRYQINYFYLLIKCFCSWILPIPKCAAMLVLFDLNIYERGYNVTRKHNSLAALCVASKQFATFTHRTNDDPEGQI